MIENKNNIRIIEKIDKPLLKRMAGNIMYPIIALGIVLSIWAIAAAVMDKPVLLPMPDVVFEKFFNLFAEEGFWTSVGWTILRTLISFGVSFVLAFLLASLGGIWRPFHRVMSPIVSILRAAPTLAVILLLIIWVDDYQYAPMFIGFLIAFPLLYSSFYSAVTGVDKQLIEMVKIYRVRTYDKVFSFFVPEMMKSIFEISESTISMTLKIVIAAEILSYTKNSIGLGMQAANLTYDIASLLAWTVLAIVLSFVLELAVSALKKLWEVLRCLN